VRELDWKQSLDPSFDGEDVEMEDTGKSFLFILMAKSNKKGSW
jgi:hypothetical protein